MSSQRRRRRTFHLSRVSDVLKELHYISGIEEPKERIAAYRDLIPEMLVFARRTEDRKFIETVENFAQVEEESRVFYELETLLKRLSELRANLESALRFVSAEVVDDLLACIGEFESKLAEPRRMALSSVQKFSSVKDQLTRGLIGRRLEKEIAPDLAKQMGYNPSPNILPDNGGEIEVDFLGEKNVTTSPFGMGRLQRKSVLVIESKTTITKSDIKKFSRKLTLIKRKYQMHAGNFRYDLKIDAWIFSCYGWTEELRELAIENGIKPFGKDEITQALRSNNLLDRRIPICP